jgi:hypothetical protein
VTPTSDCGTVGCHPDRLAAHGYDAAKHIANQTCVQSCHQPLQGLTELKPVHDAVTTPVTCAGCHATKVAQITPWDKTCTACHPVADIHPTAAALHVGTDVAYQDASFLGNGCTAVAGHTDMLSCHDISNIASVHSKMPNNGCAVCHADGKAPTTECLDCHKPGDGNSYTVPGTPSASFYATCTPNSDISVTSGWTYTTTPASQPVNGVVNTPPPPSNTTRYVTITSNTAGGVMFGYSAPSIQDNAKIRDVRIYAKAKSAALSPIRKWQGVYRIGGQDYLTSSQSPNITTAWTAPVLGTGLSSSPTRMDYTRYSFYGELLWQNPRTGQDWTPAQLNGTDPTTACRRSGST